MRLLIAALLAAVVSLGGTLLFSEFFGSIEVRDESQGDPTRKRRPDTETREECGPYDHSECGQPPSKRMGDHCDYGGIEDYVPTEIIARVFPSWPADVPVDAPEHTVIANYCVSLDGKAIDISVSGRPSPRFNTVTERAIGKWEFTPAKSGAEPIQVCQCQTIFTFEPDK